jgi:hypothetical protein
MAEGLAGFLEGSSLLHKTYTGPRIHRWATFAQVAP